MQDAQEEIRKILKMINERVLLTTKLQEAINKSRKNLDHIKNYYRDIVKLSSRIFLAIQGLKYTERALNRPFVFKAKVYDEFMNSEVRIMRHKILKVCPSLTGEDNLNLFLKTNGDVGDVKHAQVQEYEVPVGYESETDSEDDDEGSPDP